MTPFKFIYTNHRGETAQRTAIPLGVRFGSTQWHPEAQWLMRAFDLEKGEEREFAMGDISDAPVTRADDPETDGTDLAHPAWWRGNDRGVDAVIEIVNKILDGGNAGGGTFGHAPLNVMRDRLMKLVPPTTTPPGGWCFSRYVKGELKAQGITIAHAGLTFEQAAQRAVNMLPHLDSAHSHTGTVLVLEPNAKAEPTWGGMTAAQLRLRFFRDLTDAQRIAALTQGSVGEGACEATTHALQSQLFHRMLNHGEGKYIVDALNRVAASKNYGAPE